MRSSMLVLMLMGTLFAPERSFAVGRGELIPQTTARRHGLERPWFTQVQLGSSRGKVSHVVFDAKREFTLETGTAVSIPNTLFVQTNQAVLHAIDAETGQTLWANQVGRRGHPSLRPGVNENFVAVINGSYLYIVNRASGKLLWKSQLEDAPGAGAALSQKRVYVPMVNGLVVSYLLEPMKDPLEELGLIRDLKDLTPEEQEEQEAERRKSIRISQESAPPLACRSYGRALVQPFVTRQTDEKEYVVWPTDRGFLFVGSIARRENHFTMRYRLATDAGIAAQPTYSPGNPNLPNDSGVIYAASRDGFVHAVSEKSGDPLWRFSAAEPILEPAVVIDQNVYVVTQPGGMYCLDAETGAERWWAYGVAQFIAASNDRVYVADKRNRIAVLRAESGARLDTVAVRGMDIKLINSQTDRLYLASDSGLVQCLHELELSEPVRHNLPPEPVAEEPGADEEPAGEPAAEEKPAGGADPFSAPAGAGNANPFN
jgi:hypothetical protein